MAVANSYPEAIKAADALKVSYDNGPNAAVSSESILAEAKRLQALPGGELYVKDGDAAGAGEVVAIGASDAFDDAEVAQTGELSG